VLSLHDADHFKTVNVDGSYKAKPLEHHLEIFCGFLVFYFRKCRELSSNLNEDEVMMVTKKEFYRYLGTWDYHVDLRSRFETAAPALVIDDEPTAQEFIPTAPKLVVVDDEITAPSAGKHSSKHSGDKVIIQSNDDTTKLDDGATTLDNDNSKLDDPNVADLWGVDVGNDYLKDKTKKKGYITGDPAFGACMTSDFDWDPGSYHNLIDDIKEVDNIREWGATVKLISDWDDGEDHEMMSE
jgi:hypothetical protein